MYNVCYSVPFPQLFKKNLKTETELLNLASFMACNFLSRPWLLTGTMAQVPVIGKSCALYMAPKFVGPGPIRM